MYTDFGNQKNTETSYVSFNIGKSSQSHYIFEMCVFYTVITYNSLKCNSIILIFINTLDSRANPCLHGLQQKAASLAEKEQQLADINTRNHQTRS